MLLIHPVLAIVGFVSLTLATGYAVLALAAVLIWQFRRATPPKAPRPRQLQSLSPYAAPNPACMTICARFACRITRSSKLCLACAIQLTRRSQ